MGKLFNGSMPDVTPIQAFAFVTWVLTQAVSLGFMSGETDKLLLSVSGTVIPVAVGYYDAHIRRSRNIAKSTVEAANATGSTTVVNTPPAS